MYCLIFDSDGTLVDSELINNEALSLELQHTGIAETPHDLVSRYRGWKFSAVVDDLQSVHHCKLPAKFTENFRARAEIHFRQELKAIPHVIDSLRTLDHPMCVASNAPREKLSVALGITNLAQFFGDAVFSAYEVGSWKPDPDLFQHAAATMGFAPAHCIVIEDSHVGVLAAAAAGMKAVLYDPAEVVSRSEGALVIRSMQDLPGAIQQLSQTSGSPPR